MGDFRPVDGTGVIAAFVGIPSSSMNGGDKVGFFRKADIDALLAKGDVEGLIRALESERDYKVRRDAAVALGATGDARAVEPLIQALKDQSWWVRSEAASALGELADSRAVQPLGILALKDEDPHVRDPAVRALGTIGDERALVFLTQALTDEDRAVQWTAAAALDEMGYGHFTIL